MSFEDPQTNHSRRAKINLPPWANTTLMGVFVLAVIALGYFTFNGVKGAVAKLPFGVGQGTPIVKIGDPAATQSAQPGVQPVVWSGGKINILLLGIDQRRSEQGPWRTDTMILVTIDPVAKRAGMLSVPRDLWVQIPDNGEFDKINTANFRGDAESFPGGGGPALAMQTVQANFNVQVDFYVTINFYAFIQALDRIGCVPVTVSETIDDPTYPALDGFGFDPFHIDPGDYCMDSQTLLKYARTRATFGSDFDRAARQQQVIMAIRDKVLNTNELPTLIAQAPDMYNTVSEGVKTNLTLDQMIQLAQLAPDIPKENICSAVINGSYIESMQTLPDNSQVLIPDKEKVRQLVDDVNNGTGTCTPGGENLSQEATAEVATVSIINGTPQEGLASDTKAILTAAGVNVVAVGNADKFDYATTVITSYKGKTATARYLAKLLDVPETAIVDSPNPSAEYDIVVILGADYKKQ
jgi:LCP family protein required for cell wall assembly